MFSKFGNFYSSCGWYVKFLSPISHMCFILITYLSLGEVLFLKSHLIPHYVGYWASHRFRLVHFTHQVVFDFAVEMRGGEPLVLLPEMPLWYQNRGKK